MRREAHGSFHHSSFFAGEPITAGGNIVFSEGKIVSISNESGHYHPSKESVDLFVSILKSENTILNGTQIKRLAKPSLFGDIRKIVKFFFE